MVTLWKADMEDCEAIHAIQVEAFLPLLQKYQDVETNSAAEPLEKVKSRMGQETTDYYFILAGVERIGAIRVVRLTEDICRVSPLCILPAFQDRGFAQAAMKAAEALYPKARQWRLDTIKEEAKLCHLYEKLGYRKTGKEERLQDDMTIVFYEKQVGDDEK